jgi:hypothetical protein
MKANKLAANVSAIVSPQGDASLANDAGKAQRATVLQAIDTAEDLLGAALVNGLKMTAQYGPTSKDEVAENYTRCNSPDVYASTFNKGAKAAAIIGIEATVKLIDSASGDGTGGRGYRKACDALASIITQAKTAGDKSATRKATTPVVRARSTVNLATAALEAGKGHKELAAFIKLASNTAHRLPEREGRAELHREACAALAHACELWTTLAK